MFEPKELFFYPASDLCVVGHNPEAADYDNPRGEVYGERWYIVAELADGRRWISPSEFTAESITQAEQDRAACRLNTRAQRLNELPVGWAKWVEVQPCYGSEAYERGGWEAEAAYQERLEG